MAKLTKAIKKPHEDELKALKVKYPRGKRLRLIYMCYDEPVKRGTVGTICGVDDLGQIVMEWDCGSELALIPEIDKFEFL